MKKIILIILLLFTGLSASAKPNYSYATNTSNYDYSGEYIDQEITTPVYQIGLPQDFFEEQKEEAGLEIIWNSWHAKVRNNVLSATRYEIYAEKNLTYMAYIVDKNKTISNIIVIVLNENNIYAENKKSYLKPNTDFYIYKNVENKFYKMQIHQKGMRLVASNIPKILSAAQYTPVGFYAVPESSYYVKVARKIEALSEKTFLKFPNKSKRTKVVVTQGTTNIDWLIVGQRYKSTDFDDIER